MQNINYVIFIMENQLLLNLAEYVKYFDIAWCSFIKVLIILLL